LLAYAGANDKDAQKAVQKTLPMHSAAPLPERINEIPAPGSPAQSTAQTLPISTTGPGDGACVPRYPLVIPPSAAFIAAKSAIIGQSYDNPRPYILTIYLRDCPTIPHISPRTAMALSLHLPVHSRT